MYMPFIGRFYQKRLTVMRVYILRMGGPGNQTNNPGICKRHALPTEPYRIISLYFPLSIVLSSPTVSLCLFGTMLLRKVCPVVPPKQHYTSEQHHNRLMSNLSRHSKHHRIDLDILIHYHHIHFNIIISKCCAH
jgi:hypothetical protein